MQSRNHNIDLIKSIACIMVVGLHSVGMVNYTYYYLCTFGVPLFFMANGYLMFCKDTITPKYAFLKVINLSRIIILWNIILLIPMMFFKRTFINPIPHIINSTLQKSYLWHFWFLGSLILMYIMLPIIHFVMKKNLFLHIACCIILAVVCQSVIILSCRNEYPIQIFLPQTVHLWTWLFYFLAGGLFAVIKLPTVKSVIILPILILLVIASNYGQKHLGNYMFHMRQAEFFYDTLIVILTTLLLFYYCTGIKLSDKMIAIVSNFSSLSMGIYIVHPLFLKVFTTILDRFFNISINKTATALMLWVVTAIISYIISLIISKLPIIKRLITL